MAKIVVIGAGNIGRSFLGQVFARAGWETVFADVDAGLVAELNARRAYPVVVKRDGRADERIEVAPVRAVDGRDPEAVARELAGADLAAVSVGKAALPKTLRALAGGLLARAALDAGRPGGVRPLDLIIAENDREAPATIAAGLPPLLPPAFPLAGRLGLVETSIGKMVPIMAAADLAADRLLVYAEAYNDLIVDRRGFLGPVPALGDLKPVENIRAYVDRKLFVHNLGHAAVAYFGFAADPAERLVSRALRLPGVRDAARRAMAQAAAALARAYPGELDPAALEAHIDDLLDRFANAALGDTVYRVGRDLPRKLGASDRIVGAALLCARHGLDWDAIAAVFAASLRFDARDESGLAFPPDAALRAALAARGIDSLLREICGLAAEAGPEARVRAELARLAASVLGR